MPGSEASGKSIAIVAQPFSPLAPKPKAPAALTVAVQDLMGGWVRFGRT